VINLDLSWPVAAITAGCLAGSSAAIRRAGRGRPSRPVALAQMTAPFLREAGTVLALFALWQLAGSHQILGPGGALGRARWLWRVERAAHMPSEAAIQRVFLPHPLLVQAFNLYYAGLHFAVLIACLIWLFARYRTSYARVRTTVVLFTGLSLLVQFIPVAPPRMLPGDGMVDTALRYGQSVYGSDGGFNPDQLSAMPSVHIGWALLVAVVIVHVSRSRWRWLALAYPALTTLAVVVTANHFWLDGVAAAALLALALALQRAGQSVRRRLDRRYRPGALGEPPQPRAAAAALAAPGSASAIRASAAESCAADRNHAS
jgi:hypothetical protein